MAVSRQALTEFSEGELGAIRRAEQTVDLWLGVCAESGAPVQITQRGHLLRSELLGFSWHPTKKPNPQRYPEMVRELAQRYLDRGWQVVFNPDLSADVILIIS